MSPSPREITFGSIITARISSEFGDDQKIRPAIVITETAKAQRGDFAVVVVTTKLDAADSDKIELPFAHGFSATGLRERSAANCRWLRALHIEDVQAVIGHLPTSDLQRVLAKVQEILKKKRGG